MYRNVLKKDIKRKKTMNIILLIFTILASMFVSSGLSNIVTVMNGTDYFFDKAGIGDYVVITQGVDNDAENALRGSKYTESLKREECFWLTKDEITSGDKALEAKNNTVIVQPIQETGIKYFNMDNSEIETVNKGEIYLSAGTLERSNLKVGDTLNIKSHGVDETYTIAGEMKDALLGSDMMGNTRLLISKEDCAAFKDAEEMKPYTGHIYYVKTDNASELKAEVSESRGTLFQGERATIKLSYVMEMIIAMIVLVLSVCLVLVSFVLLKFVITFSIQEEFREIGVMKAIGIKNGKIRRLYIIKYLGLAVIGGFVGFIAGIPFGRMLMASVSTKMVLGNDSGLMLNIAGSLVVILIMIGFAYLCTGKVKKATPVDAIRSGQTGERFKKKTRYSRRKSHLPNALFMAVNDVLSAPRRFIIIVFSFFLCSIFVFGVVEVADTMTSDRLITTFGKKSDIFITDTKLMGIDFLSETGDENQKKTLDAIDADLKKMGIPGKASMEVWYTYPITAGGRTTSMLFQQNKRTHADEYEYIEGSAPQSKNEIAITPYIAEDLGVKVGDKVTIDFGEEKMECIISGSFQTMNQLGKVLRLHEDAPTKMSFASTLMSIQIDFDDHPDAKEVDNRIRKLKDHYDIKDVFDAAGFCNDCMGVADTMNMVAKLLLLITGIVVILVTILMERSFIQDETNQIALLKAVGFKSSFILKWHVARFMLVSLIAEVLAIALTYPVTKLWCDPIWRMMGATSVEYFFNPVSLLLVYPGIILLICLAASFLTGLYTYRIKSNSITNIE
ncbi:MAG: FtsX-like permease family protein [Lachnospiraceae bacterium]|nr:FtsX-like permease family protein [Lachnospiraceae bacterium]